MRCVLLTFAGVAVALLLPSFAGAQSPQLRVLTLGAPGAVVPSARSHAVRPPQTVSPLGSGGAGLPAVRAAAIPSRGATAGPATVTGTIRDFSGAAASGADVVVSYWDGAQWVSEGSAAANGSGVYSIGNVTTTAEGAVQAWLPDGSY